MEKLFYSHSLGFRGLLPFVKLAGENGFNKKDAVSFYNRQPINQLYSPPAPSNIPYSSAPFRLMADLVDISLFSKLNHGNKFILTVIDIGSRHGWAFGIRNKKPENVVVHLVEIYKHYKFKTFTTDDGSEFKGPVKKWLAENNIDQWISAIKGRTNLVELLNKIIVTRIFKIMKYRGTHIWDDVLDSVVAGYNADKPLGASFHTQKLIDPFSIGDHVRHPYKQGPFPKNAREQKWSDGVFRILSRDRARYILMDMDNKVLDTKYLPRQLLAVPASSTIPENNLEEEKRDIKKKSKFVRDQRKSGLDIGSEGEVIIPKAVRISSKSMLLGKEKRVVRKPARFSKED